jgi:hypothetical protein
MDYGNRCPSCRCVLFITESKLAVNVTLKSILEKHFAQEYEARTEEEKAKEVDEGTGKAIIPLFVMDVVLPLQRMALNIFEPRYRLLIRRAMSGSRTFGMIGLDRGGNILKVGCEVQIEECNCLPDGRFEIVSLSFFNYPLSSHFTLHNMCGMRTEDSRLPIIFFFLFAPQQEVIGHRRFKGKFVCSRRALSVSILSHTLLIYSHWPICFLGKIMHRSVRCV